MSPARDVVLRYFDCRSRGQALRFALVDTDTPFEDERVSLDMASFRARATDPGFAGPFAALPVLEWRGQTLAQTLVIATFLARELGLDGGAEPPRRATLEMVTHAAHLDMQVHYRNVFWRPADIAIDRLEAISRGLCENLVERTRQLEAVFATLDGDGAYFGGAEPAMADYFVFESIDRARAVFGAAYEERLAECRAMLALHASLASRPRIETLVAAGGVPFQATASPSERALRERLAAL